MRNCYYLIFAALLLASCSSKKKLAASTTSNAAASTSIYAATNKIYTHQADSLLHLAGSEVPPALADSAGNLIAGEWVGTVNFGIRKPNYVIIHFTAQDSVQQTLRTFTIARTAVSAHYVVAKNGKVYHMVNDYLRANQAGVGKWGTITDMNSCSIGIEIDNNGSEPYTSEQVQSMLALLGFLKRSYNIPTANFIGHQDWAPKRKPDPGPLFPWAIMAQHGFGYWSDELLVPAPDKFDYVSALRIIGYDTSNLKDAVVAFKRHFVQTDTSPQMTQLDLNILYNLYQKY